MHLSFLIRRTENKFVLCFYEKSGPKYLVQLHIKTYLRETMTVLDLTACMMARLTAAYFNCVFLPTNVFIRSIFKDSVK